jgi:HD-GYP domain-containing protein (c-di-GMP phosphodiesterase class II)
VVAAPSTMTHDRPHRPARSLADALSVLKEEAGRQFDPRVVEAALRMPVDRWRALLA